MSEASKEESPMKKGDICHFEIPVEDRARAKGFYGEVFGWTFQDMPEMGYTLFITPGQKVGGGFFEPNEQMPAKVVDYLLVDEIERAAQAIEKHGGQMLGPKIEVPGHGWLQHFLDTEGNHLAIWQGS